MKKQLISLVLAGILAVGAAGTAFAEETAPETPETPEIAAGVVFTAESGYVASTYTGTINGAEAGLTTVGMITDALENSLGIEVKREDTVLGADEKLKSGDKVVLTEEDGTVKSEFAVLFMGDANADSKINLADASVMLKNISKWDIEMNEMAADVNGDGAVTLADVSTFLKVAAKWGVEFVKAPVIPGKYSTFYVKGDTPCYGNPGSQGWVPICLSDGIHYDLGVKFDVKAGEFATQISFLCPSWADDKGTVNVSLYKWDGDYNSSIAAMPILTESFVDYKDNTLLFLDLKDASGKGLVEGEYVWRMHDCSDAGEGTGVGIWYFEKLAPAESTGMKTFLNCKEFNIGPVANITYATAK